MWLLILIGVALLFAALMAVLGGGIMSMVALPIGLLVAGILVVSFIRRGRDANAPQMVPAAREPTGTPRTASADPGTANKRVGQS